MSDVKWCPTMGGTYDAYSVEHFDDVSGKWKDLPTEWRDDGVGAPMPKCMGGVTAFIGLLGEAQANAIMWQAQAFAESKGERFKLRVVEYQVVYDIKARKVETND